MMKINFLLSFFHLVCENESNVIGKTSYGVKFTSAVNEENIFGVQFHPEKSHAMV